MIGLLTRTVSVDDFDSVSGATQVFAHIFGNHDGAMLSARTAEGDRQVALALVDVMGKEVDEQVGDTRDEFAGLGKRSDVLGDTGMSTGEGPEFGDEVGIGQEADIEYEIGVLGHSLAEAEADAGDQDALFGRLFVEAFVDVGPQLVDIELGGVDDEVGETADCAEVTALGLERGFYGRVGTQRMRPAGFAETAQKNGVGGFQENDLGRDQAPDRLQKVGQLVEAGTFADIDDQGSAADLAGLHGEFGKFGNQLHRQVIDAVVAEILECFQDRSLTGAAHPGDDDEFRRVFAVAGGLATNRRTLGLLAGGGSTLHQWIVALGPGRVFAPLSGNRDTGTLKPAQDRNSQFSIVSRRGGRVIYGVMKKFEELTEREVLALAISLEEEDERVYADFAEGLRQDYPATASMFEGMREEESGHRRRLLELFQKKFGEHIPLIRRQDVRGFVERPALWLVRPLRIEAVRKEASTMEVETRRFYEKAAARTQDVSMRQLLDDLANEERSHETRAQELDKQKLPDSVKADEEVAERRLFVLQIVQPGLAGLMDGSVSTLAPVFAAALATKNSWDAFLVGLAASAGAGISMGFAEALSDDGSLTGRGHPWVRGLICGAMTAVGGIGHTLPFLIRDFRMALWAAGAVVLGELAVITWIRRRYMDTPWVTAALQVGLGGVLVFITGVLIGSS